MEKLEGFFLIDVIGEWQRRSTFDELEFVFNWTLIN